VIKVVDFIEARHKFATIEETGEILYYRNGVYAPGGEALIEHLAQVNFREEMNTHRIREIKGHIKRDSLHKLAEFDADINIINMENGLYNWKEDHKSEHDPQYLSLKQASFPYTKGAKPKLFGRFLGEVLYPAEIRTAFEMAAYSFYRDNPFELYAIAVGTGANGKSVFTGVIAKLHGDQSVGNVPLKAILHNTFALVDLECKSVNIDTELSSGTIGDMAVLRKLTGRQATRVERKHQHGHDVKLYAKLWFNANKIPLSEEDTDADHRRRVIISFPNQFEGSKADPELLDKLTTKEELSGIFNATMIALRRIMKNKAVFVSQKTIAERREKYELLANPIGKFVGDYVEFDYNGDALVPKEDLYKEFVLWCKKHGLPVEQYDTFCKIVKTRYGYQDGRESSGRRRRGWIGVRLRSAATLTA
jgi:putative DNA primase/helicase